MTDKIMIDNIDVSGCKHFCLEPQIPEIPLAGYSKICAEEYIAKYCEDNPNCYYKQLKRIENQYNAVIEQNKSLQQELRTEKEKVRELEEKFKRFFNIDNQECWDLAFMNDEKEKYKQALEEIKEIASEPLYAGMNYDILKKCEVLNDV